MLSYLMSGRRSLARGGRLAERRRVRRRRMMFVCGALALVFVGAGVYGLWQTPVRVARVEIIGADGSLMPVAKSVLDGSYFGLAPRDSIFFLPKGDIRAAVLNAYPDAAAVSIARTGLNSINVSVLKRVPIARWCGAVPPAATTTSACYLFDADGVLYSAVSKGGGKPVNDFVVYAPRGEGGDEPLGTTLLGASTFPSAFDFARELGSYGSPVVAVAFRDGETDDYLASGTRVTYLTGDEQAAFTALVSAHDDLPLGDGSLDYVDLRFSGKVYVRRAR